MFLSWCAGPVRYVFWNSQTRKKERRSQGRRFPRLLFVEPLEDRTLLSSFRWTGASGSNWTDAGNWSLLSGSGTFPNAADDIARFTGTYGTAQLAVVNQAITVGEIDFGTASNITISGSNVLTFQSVSANTVLDVGASTTNSGLDLITAPTVRQSGFAAPRHHLRRHAAADQRCGNVIGSASAFTVNSTGTLRESAVGTGSLTAGNLVDASALNNAAVNLAGGSLVVDPTASLAANGLASKYIRRADAARDVQRERDVRRRDDGVPGGTPCNTSGTDCATCPTGQTSCANGCKDLTRDVMNCRTCGNVCPAPQPGTGIAVCISSTCSISCNTGYLECRPCRASRCASRAGGTSRT